MESDPSSLRSEMEEKLNVMGFSKKVSVNALEKTNYYSLESALEHILLDSDDCFHDLVEAQSSQAYSQQLHRRQPMRSQSQPVSTTKRTEYLLPKSPEVQVINPEGDCQIGTLKFESIPSKMVLVVNMELEMSIGKVASQCTHGGIGVLKAVHLHQENWKDSNILNQWEASNEKTVILQCPYTSDLVTMKFLAESLNVVHYMVFDAGITEVNSGSQTVLGILGHDSEVNQITGTLKTL